MIQRNYRPLGPKPARARLSRRRALALLGLAPLIGRAMARPAAAHEGHKSAAAIVDIDRAVAEGTVLSLKGRITNLSTNPLALLSIAGEGVAEARLAHPCAPAPYAEAPFEARLTFAEAVPEIFSLSFDFLPMGQLQVLVQPERA